MNLSKFKFNFFFIPDFLFFISYLFLLDLTGSKKFWNHFAGVFRLSIKTDFVTDSPRMWTFDPENLQEIASFHCLLRFKTVRKPGRPTPQKHGFPHFFYFISCTPRVTSRQIGVFPAACPPWWPSDMQKVVLRRHQNRQKVDFFLNFYYLFLSD